MLWLISHTCHGHQERELAQQYFLFAMLAWSYLIIWQETFYKQGHLLYFYCLNEGWVLSRQNQVYTNFFFALLEFDNCSVGWFGPNTQMKEEADQSHRPVLKSQFTILLLWCFQEENKCACFSASAQSGRMSLICVIALFFHCVTLDGCCFHAPKGSSTEPSLSLRKAYQNPNVWRKNCLKNHTEYFLINYF